MSRRRGPKTLHGVGFSIVAAWRRANLHGCIVVISQPRHYTPIESCASFGPATRTTPCSNHQISPSSGAPSLEQCHGSPPTNTDHVMHQRPSVSCSLPYRSLCQILYHSLCRRGPSVDAFRLHLGRSIRDALSQCFEGSRRQLWSKHLLGPTSSWAGGLSSEVMGKQIRASSSLCHREHT